jgi:hypothetical protein
MIAIQTAVLIFLAVITLAVLPILIIGLAIPLGIMITIAAVVWLLVANWPDSLYFCIALVPLAVWCLALAGLRVRGDAWKARRRATPLEDRAGYQAGVSFAQSLANRLGRLTPSPSGDIRRSSAHDAG